MVNGVSRIVLGLGTSLSSLYVPQSGGYTNEYSVEFDGTNDYFDPNSTFQTTLRNSFTIGFWINTTTRPTSGEHYLFGGWEFGSPYSRIYLTLSSTGILAFLMEAEGSGTLNASTSSGTIGASGSGGWMHIAMVVTKAGGSSNTTVKIFINGVDSTDTSSSGMTGTEQETYDANGKKIFFGQLSSGGSINAFFVGYGGKMDEIAIWSAALSADSLAVVGDSTFDLTSENGDYAQQGDLVSYYKFTEGSGTSVEDATGNSDGTLVNGADFDASTP